MQVLVYGPDGRIDSYEQLAAHPDQRRYIGKVLERDDPEDENAMVWLDWAPGASRFAAASLMAGLQAAGKRLSGGDDGQLPGPDALRGDEASPDIVTQRATGLEALGELDDIAIVALPDAGAMLSDDNGNYVYVIDSKNEVERRPIKIGTVLDDFPCPAVAGVVGEGIGPGAVPAPDFASRSTSWKNWTTFGGTRSGSTLRSLSARRASRNFAFAARCCPIWK